MAKSKKTEIKTELENLTSTESFIDKYKKIFIIGGIAIVVIIIGIIGYQSFISGPHEEESREVYWNAFYEFEKDSLDAAINGSNEYEGMQSIADDYAGTSGGNIATYALGIAAMEKGEYQEAINHFEDCDFEDIIIGSLVIGLQGDCYVELDQYDKAVSLFESAANREQNDFTTPMFLMKAGIVYEAQDNGAKALVAYEKIKNDWPKSEEAVGIERYISRVKN